MIFAAIASCATADTTTAAQIDVTPAFDPGPHRNAVARPRVVLREIEPGVRFVLELEGSTDGRNWAPAGLRWVYERESRNRSP
jgi:hypothetical protein